MNVWKGWSHDPSVINKITIDRWEGKRSSIKQPIRHCCKASSPYGGGFRGLFFMQKSARVWKLPDILPEKNPHIYVIWGGLQVSKCH